VSVSTARAPRKTEPSAQRTVASSGLCIPAAIGGFSLFRIIGPRYLQDQIVCIGWNGQSVTLPDPPEVHSDETMVTIGRTTTCRR